MNNDVAGKLGNNFSAQKANFASNNIIEKLAAQKTCSIDENDVAPKAMECLGVLGEAQVQKCATNSIKKSAEEFLQNPDFVQAHVDFCDSLIEHGYCLREAVQKTDDVFEVLHQEETYKLN